MDGYTQERRRLRIDTVLGQDHVLLVSLRGSDSISSHFTYDLELASADHAIQAGDMLGTPATLRLDDGTDHHATINGIVSRFTASGRDMRGIQPVSHPCRAEPVVPHPDKRLPDLPGKDRPRHC